MRNWLNNLQPWGAFCLRLALGSTMVYYGYQKLLPPGGWQHGSAMGGLNRTAQYIVSLHMPYWMAYLSVFAEFIGGILILVGLLTRFAAFLILCNMLVAYVTVNIHERYAAQQLTILLLAMALMLTFYGPGTLALDNRVGLE